MRGEVIATNYTREDEMQLYYSSFPHRINQVIFEGKNHEEIN